MNNDDTSLQFVEFQRRMSGLTPTSRFRRDRRPFGRKIPMNFLGSLNQVLSVHDQIILYFSFLAIHHICIWTNISEIHK